MSMSTLVQTAEKPITVATDEAISSLADSRQGHLEAHLEGHLEAHLAEPLRIPARMRSPPAFLHAPEILLTT
jgi:hypothetical protein